MRVNNTQDAMMSPPPSAASREAPQANFLATLDAAKQNLALASGTSPQTKSTDKVGQTSPTAPKTAAQELDEYLKKSPIQRMREAILKRMGLTEEDLAAMPPEQRAAVEETIAAKIKEELLGHNANPQKTDQQSSTVWNNVGVVQNNDVQSNLSLEFT